MRFGVVYDREEPVGILAQGRKDYRFRYISSYLRKKDAPPVSLTLRKQGGTFKSPHLFAFFYGLLAEGVQKERQCRALKLDEEDFLGRLIKTSKYDCIGAVSVRAKGDRP